MDNSKFKPGDKVGLIGNPDKVGSILSGPDLIDGSYYYEVFFGVKDQGKFEESSLEAFIESDVTSLLKNKQFVSPQEFLYYLTLFKIKKPLKGIMYSLLSSRIQFKVHQFKPLLKFLDSPNQRILIADEVGLGKTIEAGLIYTELKARMNLERVLVVCPSSLTSKWVEEFQNKFNETFQEVDGREFNAFLNWFRDGYSATIKGVISLQTLRNEEFINALDDLSIPFDVVIIDEAHHMRNNGTLNNKLGEVLSKNSSVLVLLTATPLNLGETDFFNLMHILDSTEFRNFHVFRELIEPNKYLNRALMESRKKNPDWNLIKDNILQATNTSIATYIVEKPHYKTCMNLLSKTPLNPRDKAIFQESLSRLNTLSHAFNRTLKRDVGGFPVRDSHTRKIVYSPEEKHFYEEFTRFLKNIYHKHRGIQNAAFVLCMPQRMLASCIPAMDGYLKNMIDKHYINTQQEDDAYDQYVEEKITDKLILDEEDIENLKALREIHDKITVDTKYDGFEEELLSVLRINPKRKVIVFSFFKRTLHYLKKRLYTVEFTDENGVKHSLKEHILHIDGDVKKQVRAEQIREFWSSEDFQILLSSEVGGEGLDMQVSDCIFNYDLPWNPMVVEQRIGRIDRIGQEKKKIHIHNLMTEDTIEERILNRLYERIGVFEESIGELEPILGKKVNDLMQLAIHEELTPEQEKKRLEVLLQSIEREKHLEERFEEDKFCIMGQDDFFTDRILSKKERKEFIEPSEVKLLVDQYLRRNYPKTRLVRADEFYLFKVCEKFRDDFHSYLRSFKHGDPKRIAGNAFLRKIKPDKTVKDKTVEMTFNSEEASMPRNYSLEYISIRHPLIDYISSKTPVGEDNITTYIKTNKLEKGCYVFLIYLLESKDLTKFYELVSVIVDLKKLNVVGDVDAIDIVRDSRSDETCIKEVDLDVGQIDAAVEIAENRIVEIKKNKQEERRREIEDIIDSRILSLEKFYRIEFDKIDQQLDKVEDPAIIRMRESERRRKEGELRGKKRELESQKNTIYSYRVIGAGILEGVD